jgi:phosphoribosylglycinamide formyltransferase 2
MVTLITQSQSQFALHIRAVLGLPLDFITYGEGACGAYKAKNDSDNPILEIDDNSFSTNSFVRVFGKPHSHKGRRMAVSLVFDEVEKAKVKAKNMVDNIRDN